ncbi:MAG: sialidase family protein [Kiritimatiellaeota bacterium]|nr:sialidase family protein [Kiritimatiellota bacterium]
MIFKPQSTPAGRRPLGGHFARRLFVFSALCCTLLTGAQEVPTRVLELPPSLGNPRNSEGAFIATKDGRILFVYSHYTAGKGGDHDPAYLAERFSADGGKTWSPHDRIIVEQSGGMNVMSVSLLRLQSGELALFYLRKNSTTDCRPLLRLSTDEGATWGVPTTCITDEVGYYVMNNDRAIQLKSGRLVLPVCLHTIKGSTRMDWQGTLMCYLSDDSGKTWRRSSTAQQGFNAAGKRLTTQEPGVVELKDGRVMMFIRTDGGCQYLAFSKDGGDHWTAPVASTLASPVSPASIKRLPKTGDLLLVWNDHANIPASLNKRRVPLSVALSKDDGKTWQRAKVLEGNPKGWYSYIAIHPLDDAVLLGYCAMASLKHSRITRVPLAWLYGDAPPAGAPATPDSLNGFFGD